LSLNPRGQRKLKIKLGLNEFNLNFILSYNIYSNRQKSCVLLGLKVHARPLRTAMIGCRVQGAEKLYLPRTPRLKDRDTTL